jgi:Leucine-rich repeat (LRR) protein
MKVIHLLFFIAFPFTSAKILDDENQSQNQNLIQPTTSAIEPKEKIESADAPANVTKDDPCFHADIDAMCFQVNKTGSASSCDCEQHPEYQFAMVCCNVTDINKAISCSGSNITAYQNIHIIGWTQAEINVSQMNILKQVNSLVITDGNITRITGQFSKFSAIKCLNVSNNNISEFNERALSNLNLLQVLDLSANNLTKLPTPPAQTVVDIRGNLKIPCKNVSSAIERGVEFLHKEVSKCEVQTIYNWFNSTATISILEYEKKNQLKEECPNRCKCASDVMLYTKLEGGENNLVLRTKVDCSNLGLSELPDKLPENTISLNVSNNRITSLNEVANNPFYQKIGSLFADDNFISSITDLEGSKFLENFTKLSLKNNKITQIPLYILSNLVEKNLNGKLVYLGGNKIICDCLVAKNQRVSLCDDSCVTNE